MMCFQKFCPKKNKVGPDEPGLNNADSQQGSKDKEVAGTGNNEVLETEQFLNGDQSQRAVLKKSQSQPMVELTPKHPTETNDQSNNGEDSFHDEELNEPDGGIVPDGEPKLPDGEQCLPRSVMLVTYK